MKSGRLRYALAAALLPLLSSGCGSRFNEVHYLKSVDGDGKAINYYRVTVKGSTFLSSSRYISGYFDESAVDVYFSEFTQKNDGRFGVADPEDKGEGEARVVPAGAPADGPARSLVLLLSTNSNAIAESLGTLAQSEAVTRTLINLVGGDRIRSAEAATADAAAGTALAARAEALLGADNLTDASTVPVARDTFLALANELAQFVSPGTKFSSLAEAEQWTRSYQLPTVGSNR